MEIKSILIKDTTREERKQIVEESFGNISASCDGCMAGLAEMYQEYIDGTKERKSATLTWSLMHTIYGKIWMRNQREAARCR